MPETNEESDLAHQPVPWGLRISAWAVDAGITQIALLFWSTRPSDPADSNTFDPPPSPDWPIDAVLLVFTLGITVFLFRLTSNIVFRTTPGRKLTGLRIVASADGRPASRALVAIRDLLALFLFALPAINIAWIVLAFLDPRKLGWHERPTGTTVVRAS